MAGSIPLNTFHPRCPSSDRSSVSPRASGDCLSGNIPEIVQPQFIDPSEKVDESRVAPQGGATHENSRQQITAIPGCHSDGHNDGECTGVRTLVTTGESGSTRPLYSPSSPPPPVPPPLAPSPPPQQPR